MFLLILSVNAESNRIVFKENHIQEQVDMSSWQSFFNQLSRPQQNNKNSTSEFICHCEKGNLRRNSKMEYIHTGKCSSLCFCAIIEIDKRSARKFSDNISISQTEALNYNKNTQSCKSSLEQFLDRQKNSSYPD